MSALEELAVTVIASSIGAALKSFTDPKKRDRILNEALERHRFNEAGNAKLAAMKKARGK